MTHCSCEQLLGRPVAEQYLVFDCLAQRGGGFREDEETFMHPVKQIDILCVESLHFLVQIGYVELDHRDHSQN